METDYTVTWTIVVTADSLEEAVDVASDARTDRDFNVFVMTDGERTWEVNDKTGEVIEVTNDDNDDNECEGHESLDGAHMGEAVYCDGSCKR